ncbi:hypothetical protein BHE74_00007086 [Ensete ventricosum]|nr:hypothetical protein BHE74_00007086 [Ensete ventricosum]
MAHAGAQTAPTHPHHDADGVSIGGSSPGATPLHPNYYHHHRYASSPIQDFRDSSASSWRKIHNHHQHAHYHHGAASSDCSESDDDDDDGDGSVGGGPVPVRCYVAWFALGSILLFTLFSLGRWGANKSYKPAVFVKVRTLRSQSRVASELFSPSLHTVFSVLQGVVFHCYHLQAGTDATGLSTTMLSINSTVNAILPRSLESTRQPLPW